LKCQAWNNDNKIAGIRSLINHKMNLNVMDHCLPKKCHARDLAAGEAHLMTKNKKNGMLTMMLNGRDKN